MPSAPLKPGLVVSKDSDPAYICPLFVEEPNLREKTNEVKRGKREVYLGHVKQLPPYLMVKTLATMDLDGEGLPCSPPSTPSPCAKKRQWEDASHSFRVKLRTLHTYIQETPHLLKLVKEKMGRHGPSTECDS